MTIAQQLLNLSKPFTPVASIGLTGARDITIQCKATPFAQEPHAFCNGTLSMKQNLADEWVSEDVLAQEQPASRGASKGDRYSSQWQTEQSTLVDAML